MTEALPPEAAAHLEGLDETPDHTTWSEGLARLWHDTQQQLGGALREKASGAALLLGGMLAALALFYLFKGLDLGCVRWVNAMAGTTLGVYILHQVSAFRGFLWNGLLQAEAHHGSVGYTLLAILAVFLGCAAVDALRTALVMRPLENTRLFKALCEKGDALAAKITADD